MTKKGEKRKKRRHEFTSRKVGEIAARGIKNPSDLSLSEIKSLAATALTQRPDRKK